MPVDLGDIDKQATRELRLQLGAGEDDAITFAWSPARYTRKVHQALRSASEGDEQDPFAISEASLIPLIVSWDVTKGGKPAPLTAENIAALGLFICSKMTRLIMDDMGDFSDTKKGSGAG
jgi:hypothetical protein